jgi:homoserine O-acetyltransferase/O-succinyltransferase
MTYYHLISPQTQFYQLPDSFSLESGAVLAGVEVAYRTWGQLNAARDNAVLVCHAFTGSADLDDWWQPLLGVGKALDPEQDFIVCSNILGSCYGTTGATSIDPTTGKPYGSTFPDITIRDMVHLQARLIDALGIESLKLVIGGSLGGMQVLEWALLYPERVEAIAAIATSGRHSAWCIGLSEAQRQAIYADPHWQNGNYDSNHPPAQGLAVARMIAMNTYRAWESFTERFGRDVQNDQFSIASYLQRQGKKLVERFDANVYVTLSKAMDSHDVSCRDRDYKSVLQSIFHQTLVIGINSDILYPPVEQYELANLISNSTLKWLTSPHGHDAFLIEMNVLNQLVLKFRQDLSIASLLSSDLSETYSR